MRSVTVASHVYSEAKFSRLGSYECGIMHDLDFLVCSKRGFGHLELEAVYIVYSEKVMVRGVDHGLDDVLD